MLMSAEWDVCKRCASKAAVLCDGVCGRCSVCDGCGEWTLHLRAGWCVACHAKYESEAIKKVSVKQRTSFNRTPFKVNPHG